MDKLEALQKAVEVAGGQTALARACGVTQSAVWQWLNRMGRVPAEYAIPVERATNGVITRQVLRPDLFDVPQFEPPANADREAA